MNLSPGRFMNLSPGRFMNLSPGRFMIRHRGQRDPRPASAAVPCHGRAAAVLGGGTGSM